MCVCVCVCVLQKEESESMQVSLPACEVAQQIFGKKKTKKKNKLLPQIKKSWGQGKEREGGRELETHPFIFHMSIYSGSWRRRVEQDGEGEGKGSGGRAGEEARWLNENGEEGSAWSDAEERLT